MRPRHLSTLLLFASTPALAQPALIPIPILPGTTNTRVIPRAISADGGIVVGSDDSRSSSAPFVAFIWQPQTGPQLIPGLEGWDDSMALAVSAVGPTVIGSGTSGGTFIGHGFRWTPGGGITAFPVPPGGTSGWQDVWAMTPDATVVVGYSSPNIPTRWGPSGAEALPLLPGSNGGTADAVTPDGRIVVGYSLPPGGQPSMATIWRPGALPELLGGFTSWPMTMARAVSADGTSLVGEAANSSGWGAAFRWTSAQGLDLTGPVSPADVDSGLESMSADGRVAVGFSAANHGLMGYRAAIWRDELGFRYLSDVLANEYHADLGNWTLLTATAITPDGASIIGTGTRDGTVIEGWLIHLACYPNCDNSTTPPLLNVNDLICFLNKFAAGDPYANCDQSTAPPTLNVLDFTCFLSRFAAGCP